jgi:hypothetical protein
VTVLTLSVIGLTGGSALAGCGAADNPYGLPDVPVSGAATGAATGAASSGSGTAPTSGTASGGAGSGSPATTPTRPGGAASGTPEAGDPLGRGIRLKRGRVAARSATKKAVVAATAGFMTQWLELSNTQRVDDAALDAVAQGRAAEQARERAERQRVAEHWSVGRFVLNATTVRVDGAQATVGGCHFDGTSEVDADGTVVVPPPGGVDVTFRLGRTSSGWRVTAMPERRPASCDWRAA